VVKTPAFPGGERGAGPGETRFWSAGGRAFFSRKKEGNLSYGKIRASLQKHTTEGGKKFFRGRSGPLCWGTTTTTSRGNGLDRELLRLPGGGGFLGAKITFWNCHHWRKKKFRAGGKKNRRNLSKHNLEGTSIPSGEKGFVKSFSESLWNGGEKIC